MTPRIICHMVTSLDGRLLADDWPMTGERVMALYEETAARLDAQGWIVGRRTLEEMGVPSGAPADVGPVTSRSDRVALGASAPIGLCFDRGDRRDVLARVAGAFGVETLLLEGGGVLNGALLTEGLIDETSTLCLPLVDGQHGVPAIYDAPGTAVRRADLLAVDTPGDGSVWLRHVLT